MGISRSHVQFNTFSPFEIPPIFSHQPAWASFISHFVEISMKSDGRGIGDLAQKTGRAADTLSSETRLLSLSFETEIQQMTKNNVLSFCF